MIRLISRSEGIHELLLHRLCERTGLYAAAGLEVELVDGRGPRWRAVSGEENAATLAVGGVVAEWLHGDRDWRVDFVATARPLVWIAASRPLDDVPSLRGARVGTPRLTHMPSVFLRVVLARHGLHLGSDVVAVEVDDRPDRQRLLETGAVDAALVGPEGLSAHGDDCGALFLGDHIEFPTVGLASRPGADRKEVDELAAVFAAGLQRLRSAGDGAVIAAMRGIDPLVTEAAARFTSQRIATSWGGPEWATEGRLGDVALVAEAIGATVRDTSDLRRFLHAWIAPS